MNDVTYLNSHKDLFIDQFGQMQGSWEDGGSTVSTIVVDLRGKRCYICGQPWELRGRAFTDHALVHEREHVHQSCLTRVRTLTEWCAWEKHLGDARIFFVDGRRVPNPYASRSIHYPDRFEFDLDHVWRLKLVVGSRKRVDEIRFMGMPYELFQTVRTHFNDTWKSTNGQQMDVAEEGSFVYVHTWNDEEIKAVLTQWREIVVSHERKAKINLQDYHLKNQHGNIRWRTFTQIDAHFAEQERREAEYKAKDAAREKEQTANA